MATVFFEAGGGGSMGRLSVCFQETSKRLNRFTFCVGPHMTPGKVYACSELKKVLSKFFVLSRGNAERLSTYLKMK